MPSTDRSGPRAVRPADRSGAATVEANRSDKASRNRSASSSDRGSSGTVGLTTARSPSETASATAEGAREHEVPRVETPHERATDPEHHDRDPIGKGGGKAARRFAGTKRAHTGETDPTGCGRRSGGGLCRKASQPAGASSPIRAATASGGRAQSNMKL